MTVRQAAHVLELLEYFARRRRPATLSEVAQDLGWPRSSTFNLLGTLAERGYLYEPRARDGYYPTPRLLALAQSIAEAEPLPEALTTLLRELVGETGETAAIAASAGTSAVFIEVCESLKPVRYFAQAGLRMPIHITSCGRAILSQYRPPERAAVLRRVTYERFGPSTPMSAAEVEAEIRHSLERGWFQNLAEFSQDLCGVSLPLPLAGRQLALVVAGPISRMQDRIPALAARMRRGLERALPAGG
ncbi:IclR family transcriptional regulator [Neoroseomonas soli]|uniref:IclR family transcriptional regulator n=1 Tax=Neoroseomonas soli TaxID=1081025 RepID=A0A9X9WRA5_9PROT|nr:IclR family transcriptional regulator [Neoroseomonas soli]MBR0669684.1 IclR family transcriptional regulator [Neoroseomonas soli]